MKKINPAALGSLNELSWVLDQALFLLANSPAKLRLSELSQATGIHASVLTRMRLVHINPQYEHCVNLPKLVSLLRFIQERFPTLVIRVARNGNLQVRLFQTHAGYKLAPLSCTPAPTPIIYKRKLPKPGSTRWFLDQTDTELFNSRISAVMKKS